MTDEEANELSQCGYGCHVIGGPWISFNPDCPVCCPWPTKHAAKVESMNLPPLTPELETYIDSDTVREFVRAYASEAQRMALEEAVKACEKLGHRDAHDSQWDRPADERQCADAIRKLAEAKSSQPEQS